MARSPTLSRLFLAAALVTLATLATLAGSAQAGPPDKTAPRGGDCFDITRHRGVLPLDDQTVLVRLDGDTIYRVELADHCPALMRPDPQISLIARGGALVCGPLDWDLRVSGGGQVASAVPCTIKSQRRLTPDEVAAIPRNKRP
jgi:hypothetical protein